MSRRRKRSPEAQARVRDAWIAATEQSVQRRKANGTFPGEGELDEQGNTRCVGCGKLFSVLKDYAIWAAEMKAQYPDEPIETMEESVADCKALCEGCGSAF